MAIPLSIATCRKRIADYLWYQSNRHVVDAGVKEWQLLLQIESNKNVGLWWWDAGSVQIMIRALISITDDSTAH